METESVDRVATMASVGAKMLTAARTDKQRRDGLRTYLGALRSKGYEPIALYQKIAIVAEKMYGYALPPYEEVAPPK